MNIHIIIGSSGAGSLKWMLREPALTDSELVISFHDIFSVGPIGKLETKAGLDKRAIWMMEHLPQDQHERNFEEEYQEDFCKSLEKIADIPEEATITLWCADNASEQVGLRFVLFLLAERKNEVTIINTTKSHKKLFSRPGIIYTVLSTGEVNPDKLKEILDDSKSSSPLSSEERGIYIEEWENLSVDDSVLRIWENNVIKPVSEDYYDEYIFITAKKLQNKRNLGQFMKSARVIGEAIGHLEQYVGDQFLEYRLKSLISRGKLESKGSLESMRYYSVRVKSSYY